MTKPPNISISPEIVTTERARQIVGGNMVFRYLQDRGLRPMFTGASRGRKANLWRLETLKAALDEVEVDARGKPIDLGAALEEEEGRP